MSEKNKGNVKQAKTLYSSFWHKSSPVTDISGTARQLPPHKGMFSQKSTNCEFSSETNKSILSGMNAQYLRS